MRLINADTVDLRLCDWYPTREIKDLLNRQPTAYDVDKVVEQLEKGIDPNVDCDTGEPCNNWAVDWCKNYGLIFDTINEQLPELTELYGNDTRKICADIYIDDKGVNPMPGRAITGILTGSPYIKMTKGSRLRKKKAAGVV